MAKKQMTEEEKAAFAEKMAQSRAKKKQEEEARKQAEQPKQKSELELLREQNELLMKQLSQLQEKMASQPQVVRLAESTEKVHFLWQAEVAEDNIVYLGDRGQYGRIVGKTGEVFVPKNELTNMLDEKTRWYMDKRWLIVVDGLTDEEREAYNVKYSDGETLDKKQFAKITEMGDKILDIYPKLCREHQIMIAKRFAEVNENGKKKLSRDLVVALNNMSKKFGNKKGDFVAIIESMNSKELDEE